MNTDFAMRRSIFLNTNITNITNLPCGLIFYSPTDGTDEHRFYHADVYIFGTRMDTDGHGFYHADVFIEHEICRRPTDQREVI